MLCIILCGLLGNSYQILFIDIFLNNGIVEYSKSQRPKFHISEFKPWPCLNCGGFTKNSFDFTLYFNKSIIR